MKDFVMGLFLLYAFQVIVNFLILEANNLYAIDELEKYQRLTKIAFFPYGIFIIINWSIARRRNKQ